MQMQEAGPRKTTEAVSDREEYTALSLWAIDKTVRLVTALPLVHQLDCGHRPRLSGCQSGGYSGGKSALRSSAARIASRVLTLANW